MYMVCTLTASTFYCTLFYNLWEQKQLNYVKRSVLFGNTNGSSLEESNTVVHCAKWLLSY